MTKTHDFVLILDTEPMNGHLFGDLKLPVPSEDIGSNWVVVERRCRLCNRLPMELLNINGSLVKCDGLRR